MHQELLDMYGGYGSLSPAQFVNDGYILLAIGHHFVGAGQLEQLRGLLTNPAWLMEKLHCYGVAAVVEDFRRWVSSVRCIHKQQE